MTSLEADSMQECVTALRRHNFAKRRRWLFIQQHDTGADGWLGVNVARAELPEKLEVNPVVGVRHAALEAALLELRDDLPKPPLPSVSRPLGYLMPDQTYREWTFSAGDDLSAVAADLASAVAKYGQPFIDKYADWDTFSAEIESSGLVLEHERAKLFPIVAAMNGDRARADELVRQELAQVADRADVYAESYRRFAERFARKSF